jgi:hypothetical protein
VEFNSTVTGDILPYHYQWFLNGSAFEGATSASWTFTPPTSGIYSVYLIVYLSVNNSTGNETQSEAQSETARVVAGSQLLTGFFGYPFASSQAEGSGTKYTADGSRFMLNVEANVTSISCLMDIASDPNNLNQNYSYSFAIYKDSYGSVTSLVAQTVQAIITNSHNVPLWYTLNFPSVVHLTPGAYWLMVVHNASQFISVHSAVQDPYVTVSSFIGSMNFPASLPSPIYSPSYVLCIYASWDVSFSARLTEEKNVFSVTSNSTISSLAYNSTKNELSFKVSGPSGTTGYTEVFISKTLLPNFTGVTVSLDGKQLNFSVASIDDSWSLHFVYSHSTHNVTINMQSNAVPEFPTPFLAVFLAIAFAFLLCLSYPIKKVMRAKIQYSVSKTFEAKLYR